MTSPFYQYGVEYSNSASKTLDFYFGDPLARLHGPYRMSPTPGVWTHVAYTYDGTMVRGYLDGVERLATSDAASLQRRGTSFRLGVDGAYQQFLNGSVDDLRIYSRALTPAEVRSAMQTPVGRGGSGDVPAGGGSQADGLALTVNTPNPFRTTTRIAFTLPAAGEAALEIFDIAGRLVRVLERGSLGAGGHEAQWDGHDAAGQPAASGRYFLRLRAGRSEKTVSMVLVR
jgi:hypothetical protein